MPQTTIDADQNAIRCTPVVIPAVPPEDLTEFTDINGHELVVGAPVRSFDHIGRDTAGRLTGLSLDTGRVSYVEGILIAIGVAHPSEGYPCYVIRPTRRVRTRVEGGAPEVLPHSPTPIVAPVNGLDLFEYGPSFGVVRLIAH